MQIETKFINLTMNWKMAFTIKIEIKEKSFIKIRVADADEEQWNEL